MNSVENKTGIEIRIRIGLRDEKSNSGFFMHPGEQKNKLTRAVWQHNFFSKKNMYPNLVLECTYKVTHFHDN